MMIGMVAMAVLLSAWGAPSSRAAPQPEQGEVGDAMEQASAALFKADPNIHLIRVPTGPGAARVCADSDALRPLYAGRGIQAITGSVPFSPASAPSNNCHVRITSTPNAGRDLFKSRSCTVRVLADGKVDILVAPSTIDEFAAAECFYRLALVLEGFAGGFTAPVFGEFPNSVYFAGKRSYVGPIVAPAVQKLVRTCRGIVNHYYSSGLNAFARAECNLDGV